MNTPKESFIGMPDLITFIDLSNNMEDEEICSGTIKYEEEFEKGNTIDLFQNNLIVFFYEHYEEFAIPLSKLIGNLIESLSIYETVQFDYPTMVQNYAIGGILKAFYKKVIIKHPHRARAVEGESFFTNFIINDESNSIYPKIEIVLSHQALVLCNENKFCEIRPIK